MKRGAQLVENAIGPQPIAPQAVSKVTSRIDDGLSALRVQQKYLQEPHVKSLCLHCNADECWLRRLEDVPYVRTQDESLLESKKFCSEITVFDVKTGSLIESLVNAKIISAGSYGKTYQLLDTSSLKQVIVKTINIEKDQSKHLDICSLERALDLELKAYERLKEKRFPYSPFVRYCIGKKKLLWDDPQRVRVKNSIWKNHGKCPGFIMPYFPVDLHQLPSGSVNWMEILDCCWELGEAGFVHCDLKPEHIRYTSVEEMIASESSLRSLRFVDFGIARFEHETCFHIPPHVYSAPEGLPDWKRDFFSVLIMFLDKEFPRYKVSERFNARNMDKRQRLQLKWDFLMKSEDQYSKSWPTELIRCLMLFSLRPNAYSVSLPRKDFYLKLCFSMVSMFSLENAESIVDARGERRTYDEKRSAEKQVYARACINFCGLKALNPARLSLHQHIFESLMDERERLSKSESDFEDIASGSSKMKYWKHICNRYNRKRSFISPRQLYWYILLVEIHFQYTSLFH